MSVVQTTPTSHTTPPAQRVEFLSPAERSDRCRRLAKTGFLVARVAPLIDSEGPHDGPLRRGRLREAIDGAVEISLALRGALPPSIDSDADPCAIAEDQLFRVRALGSPGLCLVLPTLMGLADERDVLDFDDSRALAVWHELTETDPVVLLIDDEDRHVKWLAPESLGSALVEPIEGAAHQDWHDAHPDIDDHEWETDTRNTLLDVPPFEPIDDERPLQLELDIGTSGDQDAGPTPLIAGHIEPGVTLREATSADVDVAEEPLDDAFDEVCNDDCDDDAFDEEPLAIAQGTNRRSNTGHKLLPDNIFDEDAEAPCEASIIQPVEPTFDRKHCRTLAHELNASNGPQPVSAIENMYVTRYLPLLVDKLRGLKDELVDDALKLWRTNFEHSYSDGYKAIRLTGKRPQMVLDVPEIASRIARLNGARTVQLLLVDGLRHDLGSRVMTALADKLCGAAVCVDETVLWSALPTLTPTQMHLLARGPRGLREQEPTSERNALVQRAGSVTTLRRVRIGHRDLVKLDVVEARLRDAGGPFDERMNELADEVATVVARFIESLGPRTLLYVFGDHGYRLQADARGTSPAQQGGASPEEVLVGGHAWLVGDVH